MLYKIYKITCNETKQTYIGSTKQLIARRITYHKSEAKTEKKRLCVSRQIMDREDWYYEVIYDDIIDKKTAFQLEKTMINSDVMCINIKNPIETKEERLKRWRIKNHRNKESGDRGKRAEYLRNRDFYMTKNICECGGRYTNKNIRVHEKSKRHIALIN
jgi:predicted GIY-YIG superfamily endonuclease